MVSTKQGINFIESYSCDVDFSFLKKKTKYLVEGVVKTHYGLEVDKTIKSCKEYGYNPNDPVLIPYRTHLQECLDDYIKKYDLLNKHPHFNIYDLINYQRYDKGQGYYDYHFENFDCGRVIVFMTYLTNTSGAGTEFLYQNIKTECVKGTTLLWPAYWTHTHRGIISKTSRKEIITGWFSTRAPS